jgi:octaprenyl-diphosphate synthase
LVQTAIETGDVTLLDQVIAIVRSTGALEVAQAAAQGEAQRAIHAAQKLPEGVHTDALVSLATQLLERNH